MDQPEEDVEYDPADYAMDLKHELRVRGMPDMDLTCNVHDDGFLAVFISNCSSTDFTLQAEIPNGATDPPKRVAEAIYQTFLDYLEEPEVDSDF